jgi:putative peptidoglycan lipid II flippase
MAFIKQSYLMLPLLALAGVIGVLFGAVSFKCDYFWPSLSPLISSLALILCLCLGYKIWGEWVLGFGTALGAILQALIQFIDLSKYNFQFALTLPIEKNQKDSLKYFFAILLPALLSSTIGSLNVYVDSFFTANLAKGSWTAILLGNRLIQLPFGILVGAGLISFLPRISACKDDKPQFENILNTEINNLFFLMIPATAILLALSEPIIKFLFERGQFTAESTNLVNLVLLGLAGSLLTALPREVFTRAFYALGDSKTPLIVSLVSIILNALFDWWLAAKFAVAGIALSTTLTSAFNSVLIVFLLQAKIKNLKITWLKILPLLALGFLSSLVAKLVFTQISFFLQAFRFNAFLQLGLSLTVSVLAALVLYFGIALYLKKKIK